MKKEKRVEVLPTKIFLDLTTLSLSFSLSSQIFRRPFRPTPATDSGELGFVGKLFPSTSRSSGIRARFSRCVEIWSIKVSGFFGRYLGFFTSVRVGSVLGVSSQPLLLVFGILEDFWEDFWCIC